jgi:hypothetical protein
MLPNEPREVKQAGEAGMPGNDAEMMGNRLRNALKLHPASTKKPPPEARAPEGGLLLIHLFRKIPLMP